MGESINKRHKQLDIKIILKKENLAEEANNKMRKKIPNKKVESKEKSKSNMRENPEQRERERERERCESGNEPEEKRRRRRSPRGYDAGGSSPNFICSHVPMGIFLFYKMRKYKESCYVRGGSCTRAFSRVGERPWAHPLGWLLPQNKHTRTNLHYNNFTLKR
jgi:hypothetical protein